MKNNIDKHQIRSVVGPEDDEVLGRRDLKSCKIGFRNYEKLISIMEKTVLCIKKVKS